MIRQGQCVPILNGVCTTTSKFSTNPDQSPSSPATKRWLDPWVGLSYKNDVRIKLFELKILMWWKCVCIDRPLHSYWDFYIYSCKSELKSFCLSKKWRKLSDWITIFQQFLTENMISLSCLKVLKILRYFMKTHPGNRWYSTFSLIKSFSVSLIIFSINSVLLIFWFFQ